MTVFFIGDTHFGHHNIIQFDVIKAYRPFATIEEHDAELIRRWNSVVKPEDTVWHLGDFCLGGKKNIEIASQLNGKKNLVLGNHDAYDSHEYLKYFHRLYGMIDYKGVLLSHMPVHPQQLQRYKFNVHGHLHTHHIDDPRYLNVSSEQVDLTPISWDEVVFRITNNGLKAESEELRTRYLRTPEEVAFARKRAADEEKEKV